MKASDLFVRALENEGVEYIFGIPGEENLDLLESLRSSSIKLVITRHEQAAGFMAATYGRLTGRAGVCLSTLGPGATNLVTAAAYAQLGGMPMLMITGQKPIKKSKQGHFQIIDVVNMMKPLTKHTKQIVNGASIAANVREAFRVAQEERPGATHLELPEDIASEEVVEAHIYPAHRVRRAVAEEKAILMAIEMIQSAKTPLLLVGAGANRKMTSAMLSEFIDKTGIYFFNTQMGKGVVDERHPLFLGTAAFSSSDFVHEAIASADLIINVGHDLIEKPPFFMKHGDPLRVIHINFFSASIDQVYFPQLEVVGDVANAIWQIKQGVAPQPHWDFNAIKRIQEAGNFHLTRDIRDERFPIIPQVLVQTVRDALSEDGIVALDNGMYKLWFARYYKAYQQNTLLLDNALATMGAGLPSAIATKLVYPNRRVVAVCGDGGFMMNSQELETAIRLGVDLVIILVNDGGYGMIKWKQSTQNYSDFGLNFNNPDFVKYVESYGGHGYRVSSVQEFSDVLRGAIDSSGVHLIDLQVDYSENKRVFDDEILFKK